MTAPASEQPARPGIPGWLRAVLAVAVIGGLIYAARAAGIAELIPKWLEAIRRLGPAGWFVFVGLYILACVFFVPGSLLTLGAGAVFGVGLGSALVSVGSVCGATISFLIGRFLARDWVFRKASGNPRFAALDAAIGKEGWKIVGLLRLSPVFPFTLLNYLLGVTRVSLRDYVLASWIGMMPGTVMYVYLGSVFGTALASGGARQRTSAEWALYAVGLVATIAVTVWITKIAKAALGRKLDAPATATPDSRP